MTCKLVAEVGSCWKPGNFQSLKDACKAALDCGADLVKVQVFNAESLAVRRNCSPEKLRPWSIPVDWLQHLEPARVNDKVEAKLGISLFRPEEADVLRDFCSVQFAFVKSASQEYQYARLAESLSRYSCKPGVPLVVSVPPDGTLAVGNYYSPYPITWLWCEPFYPANEKYLDYKRLDDMASRLPGQIGVSDHTSDVSFARSLLAQRKVDAWEKHFCYDESLRGNCPDGGPWSLSREKFRELAKIVHGE